MKIVILHSGRSDPTSIKIKWKTAIDFSGSWAGSPQKVPDAFFYFEDSKLAWI